MSYPKDPAWPVLAGLVNTQRSRFILTIGFAGLAALLELAPFWLLFRAVELLLATEISPADTARLYELAAWMGLALVAKTLAYGAAYALSHQAAFLILAGTRRQLVTRLAYAPLERLEHYPSGRLKHAVVEEVEKLENFFAHHSVEVAVAVFGPVLATSYLLFIDWRLALAALLAAPAAVISALLFTRGMHDHFASYQQAATALNGTLVECLRNLPVAKLFGRNLQQFHLLNAPLKTYQTVVDRITRLTVPRWALFTTLLGASLLFILPLGVLLHRQGDASLVTVMMAVLMGAGMLRPLLKISRFFNELQEILASVADLAPLLAEPGGPPRSGTAVPERRVKLQLQQIAFAYDRRPVLSDINLCFHPGTSSVILGMSGSGKSTLAQLMAGLLLPDSGELRVNDRPLAAIDDNGRAAMIALASQEIFLFRGSLRDNLLLARPDATAVDLERVLEIAQARPFVDALPDGLDTRIEELGGRLSGGERQRLALARTLLVDAPVLILDEATAFADSLTQRAFYLSLRQHSPGKTLIIIAHRTCGLETMDQIVLLEQGKVRATGRHEALLRSDPGYRQLWRLQQDSEHWQLRATHTTGSLVHEK